jgi:3'-phosphoadenosine 5'-phosphosulfate sulfotransferase (PAPS reductase)/FAD synthetase
MTTDQTNFFKEIEGERILCWFSCGATSAVACKLAIAENNGKLPIRVIYCDTGGEHHDNERFIVDCEKWFGIKIERAKNPNYKNLDHLFEKDRYLNGVNGARCTQQLKVWIRLTTQRVETDLQVFGFDYGELDRELTFRENNPDVRLVSPLIERKMSKPDCLAMLKAEGIELPEMYKLGYKNNNCIGCVKGGQGYWNKIRIDFPEVFERRARQEREIGASCLRKTIIVDGKKKSAPLWLDELDPKSGRYEAEPDISCQGVCVDARKEIENCEL